MKTFLTFLSVVLSSAALSSPALAKDDTVLHAVAFHADWCGSCKIVGPNLVKARGKAGLDEKNVLFVKLDLTNPTTRHQSSLLASAIGLGEYYKENAGKTGYVLLVKSDDDGDDSEIVGKLTKDMDANAMIAKITENL